jgi:Zn-dependent protease/CBS domain-containing protein
MKRADAGSFGIRQFRLFSLFGFEVKLDLSWLLLGLLIGWSLGAGLFPQRYPGLSPTVYTWMGVSVAIAVFFSIVFHEFSHSIVARYFGMPIRGITLFIFGGVAEMEREPPGPKSEFLMAIAGPIASFLLAWLFWVLERFGTAASWPVPVTGVCHTIWVINLSVAVFNLVPAFPLDGGRVLRAALWHFKRNLRTATFVSSRIGRAFGMLLILLGIVSFIGGNPIGGMWWFLIGLFVRGAAESSYQQMIVSEVIRDKPVSEFMRRDPVAVPPSITVEEWLNDYVYPHHYKLYPVLDGSRLLGCISLDAVRSLSVAERGTRRVRDLVQPSSEANTVSAGMSTSSLLARMLPPTAPKRYMVVDDGKLVGMISLKDLTDLISIRLELASTA